MNKSKNIEKIYKVFLKKKSVKIDSRKIKKGDIFFAISGQNFNANTFAKNALKNNAELVILDDEKTFKQLINSVEFIENKNKIILVDNCLETLQNLAKKYRSDLKIPFLGITGSNGKTTTKELVRDVLMKKYNVLATVGNLNNHIGVPLTILSINDKHNFVIIEIGANHMGEIKSLINIVNPDFGIITNIGLAHIGEFGSEKNIFKAKRELYDGIFKNNKKIFLNKDDQMLKKASEKILDKNKIFYLKGEVLKSDKFLEVKINNLKIKTKLVGQYNVFNLQAAYTVGNFFKVEEKKIVQALKNYIPKNNRSEILETKNNNEIILDCYNANPSSMKLVIESFGKNKTKKEKVFILGQMGELGKFSSREHKKVLEQISKISGKYFLVGEEFLMFEKEFSKNKYFKFFGKTDELKEFLKKNKLKNYLVLIKGSNTMKLFELNDKNIL